MKRLAIIGGGSWGTALALVAAPRFDQVQLWVHDPALAAFMTAKRENPTYLPGFTLPPNVSVTDRLQVAGEAAEMVLGVMPSRHARAIYAELRPYCASGTLFVSATKGLETHTLLRMSQVMEEELAPLQPRLAVLSGPNFAHEVASGDPTATVISSNDSETAARVQTALASSAFRLYTNPDPVGVEIGAALKNVFAIAAGVCEGLGLGSNTAAALVTRGLAEMTRLSVALGGSPLTMAGLAGLGDLVLTCYGARSRNRQVGLELAKGRSLQEIVGSMKMVAEGVDTTAAAIALADRAGVDLPITAQMASILDGRQSPREAIRELMERTLKSE